MFALKCLKYVTPVCLSVQYCYASIQTEDDFKRLVFEKCWGAWASKTVNVSNSNEWYTKELYSNSIYKTMATAIADCMTWRAEFKKAQETVAQKLKHNNKLNDEYTSKVFETLRKLTNKKLTYEDAISNGPKVPEYDYGIVIVEFDAKPTVEKPYTPENWNAVVLWNYLVEAIHGFLYGGLCGDGEKCIDAVGNAIKTYYKDIDGIDGHIDKAVSDIKEYAKALNLYNYVWRLKKLIEACYDSNSAETPYKSIGYAINQNEFFDPDLRTAEFCLTDVNLKINNSIKNTSVNIKIRNGEVEYQTPYGAFKELTPDMTVKNQITQKKYSEIYYKDLTQELNPCNIHSLCNNLTCHIDSLIVAMSMSHRLTEAIKKVAVKQSKEVKIGSIKAKLTFCKELQKMLDAVKSGSMSCGTKGGYSKYVETFPEFQRSLAETLAIRATKRTINEILYQKGNVTDGKAEQLYKEISQHSTEALGVNSGANVLNGIITQVFGAISYELRQNGFDDLFNYTETEILKFEKAGLSRIYYTIGHEGLKLLGKETSGIDTALKEALESKYEASDFGIDISETERINDTQKVVARINELPTILALISPGKYTYPNRKEYIYVTDSIGLKKYKLISEIAHLPAHFVAQVNLKGKFYVVDDFYPATSQAIEEGPAYDYRKMNNPHPGAPRERLVSIYERCE